MLEMIKKIKIDEIDLNFTEYQIYLIWEKGAKNI